MKYLVVYFQKVSYLHLWRGPYKSTCINVIQKKNAEHLDHELEKEGGTLVLYKHECWNNILIHLSHLCDLLSRHKAFKWEDKNAIYFTKFKGKKLLHHNKSINTTTPKCEIKTTDISTYNIESKQGGGGSSLSRILLNTQLRVFVTCSYLLRMFAGVRLSYRTNIHELRQKVPI